MPEPPAEVKHQCTSADIIVLLGVGTACVVLFGVMISLGPVTWLLTIMLGVGLLGPAALIFADVRLCARHGLARVCADAAGISWAKRDRKSERILWKDVTKVEIHRQRLRVFSANRPVLTTSRGIQDRTYGRLCRMIVGHLPRGATYVRTWSPGVFLDREPAESWSLAITWPDTATLQYRWMEKVLVLALSGVSIVGAAFLAFLVARMAQLAVGATRSKNLLLQLAIGAPFLLGIAVLMAAKPISLIIGTVQYWGCVVTTDAKGVSHIRGEKVLSIPWDEVQEVTINPVADAHMIMGHKKRIVIMRPMYGASEVRDLIRRNCPAGTLFRRSWKLWM